MALTLGSLVRWITAEDFRGCQWESLSDQHRRSRLTGEPLTLRSGCLFVHGGWDGVRYEFLPTEIFEDRAQGRVINGTTGVIFGGKSVQSEYQTLLRKCVEGEKHFPCLVEVDDAYDLCLVRTSQPVRIVAPSAELDETPSAVSVPICPKPTVDGTDDESRVRGERRACDVSSASEDRADSAPSLREEPPMGSDVSVALSSEVLLTYRAEPSPLIAHPLSDSYRQRAGETHNVAPLLADTSAASDLDCLDPPRIASDLLAQLAANREISADEYKWECTEDDLPELEEPPSFACEEPPSFACEQPADSTASPLGNLDSVEASADAVVEKQTFEERDIELIMVQVSANRDQAIRALTNCRGDLVDAIMVSVPSVPLRFSL